MKKTIRNALKETSINQTYGEGLSLEAKLRLFFTQVELVLKDKRITLQELVSVYLCGLRLCVSTVEAIPIEGDRRKILVMSAARKIFDQYAYRACPLLLKPFWFIVEPIIKPIALSAASGAVEFLVPLVRNPNL